jgi:hypothetical protein
MTIAITTDTLTVNESDAIVSPLQADETTLAAFIAANPTIATYLSDQTSAGTDGDISTPQVAVQTDFVKLSIPAGTTLQVLTFASDSAGTDFPTSGAGIDSGLKTIDGDPIFLYGVEDQPSLLVGRTVDASGDISFALVLQEAVGGSYTGWVIQYEAQYHDEAGKIGALDFNDLTNKVFVSADSTTAFPFVTLQGVQSGNPDFYLIAPDSSGPAAAKILITTFNETGTNGTVNVSTQGIGVGSQSTSPNEVIQIDFVKAPTTGQGSGSQISYTAHEEVEGAGFTISQITPNAGGNERINIELTALDVTGDEQGADFFNGTTTTFASITRVIVRNASGTIVEDTGGSQDDLDITIAGLNGSVVTVNGLMVDYRVEIVTDGMERLRIRNTEADRTDIDIDDFFYTDTVANTDNKEIGSQVQFQDDGPVLTATVTNADTAQVDETTLGVAGKQVASLGAQFTPDYGADEAAAADDGPLTFTLDVKAQDVASGLTDSATETSIVLHKVSDALIEGRLAGTDTVALTFELASNGDVTFTQLRAVKHPTITDPNDSIGLAANDLITLTGVAKDSDLDPSAAQTLEIAGLFTILDDGPTIVGSGATVSLTTDESFLPTGSEGTDLTKTQVTADYSTLFTPTSGNDGAGGLTAFTLGIKDGVTESGFTDCDGNKILLSLDEGVISGRVGTTTFFTISVDTAGKVTLDQLQAMEHGAPLTGTNDVLSFTNELITLSASATDSEGDESPPLKLDISSTFTFKDDLPTIGVNDSATVSFTAGQSIVGTVGGVAGADTATVTLTTSADLAGFNKVQNGDTVSYYKTGTNEKWFEFTVDGDGTYDFDVLQTGTPTNETFAFGSVKPGAPVETATVKSQFDHAIGVFDGVIFKGAGPNNYTNLSTKNVDDINPDNLGFGIMGTNPNQASQINNDEGFLVQLEEGSDTFQFDIQGIGNNAKGVHVEYTAWNDTNDNGVVDGSETAVKTETVRKDVLSGNTLTNFKIDADSDFDAVNVRFYFDSTDLQNGALSGPALRQAIDNAGVRILNFGVKQDDTIPEYDFAFGMKRTDCDGDMTTEMLASIHVDPDLDPSVNPVNADLINAGVLVI